LLVANQEDSLPTQQNRFLREKSILIGYNIDWIVEALENPVAVIDDEFHHSFNYYGHVNGRDSLLRVAISKSDLQLIVTVYFDSAATRRSQRVQL